MILRMTNIHYLIHIVKIQRFNWVIYISIGEHHYFQQTITNNLKISLIVYMYSRRGVYTFYNSSSDTLIIIINMSM